MDRHKAKLSGRQIRSLCRSGDFCGTTAGVATEYVQTNLVVVRSEVAPAFEQFCRLNPLPCPVLAVTSPGDYEPKSLAPCSDLRTDLPKYCVIRNGQSVETPTEIRSHWTADCVAFLIGCSFTFEAALLEAGIPVRHVEEGCNVPMYRTDIACASAGRFRSDLVVSMRPMTERQADEAHSVTSAFPKAHGAPIHRGDPAAIGIVDLNQPDYGDSVSIQEGEIPVFWACGVTPLEALKQARLDLAITHAPGHMFVTDLYHTSLRES